MKIPAGTVLTLGVFLVLCGCQKKHEDCAALEIRFDNSTGMTQGRLNMAKMREFLWSHWRARTCAKLLFEGFSKEGKETDDLFEIKLLPATTLVMVVTTNRASYGYQGQVLWHEVAKYDVYTVERVQPNNIQWPNLNSKVEVLPADADLSGADYRLRFKGWGDQVESFF